MLRNFIIVLVCLLSSTWTIAQNLQVSKSDSLKLTQLEKIVITSHKTFSDKATNPLTTLDNYLEKSDAINMIRRGSYAWEPFINGMATERSVITIDGMRIYGACTDKMDPVTSYVETLNLERANIHSGQSGSTGATIGGSLDLERKKSSFGEKMFSTTAFAGFESNNFQKIFGKAFSFSSPRFYTDIDFTFRDADNYRAGGRQQILYSQFTKYNVSAIAGFKINKHQEIEGSLIYDHAVDVGYPALPMDVSMARAIIGSLEYVRHHISPTIHLWESKIYYNDITHIMDDTKRPIVPIRMDMPGWSKTAGFYSSLQGEKGKHSWKAIISGHHNRSLAEMTMFSNNPNEKDMFMLTWPGVLINYADLFAEDNIQISKNWTSKVSLGFALHNNMVNNDFGLESLRIFYPDMKKSKSRMLSRVSSSFEYSKNNWSVIMGMAYGERAPSVSEGYGFYLFNSFDRFDYIGNANLKNEKSASINAGVSYNHPKIGVKIGANNFFIADYIIARPQANLSVMTIGAAGVKVYEQLKYANIFNASLDINWNIIKKLIWSTKFSYRLGMGENVRYLPLMQPFSYYSNLSYSIKSFSAEISVNGAAPQTRFNPEFGEKPLADYAILNLALSNRFTIKNHSLLIKAGVENILDTKYTTFSDWNRLPRMGRNIFVNIVWKFVK